MRYLVKKISQMKGHDYFVQTLEDRPPYSPTGECL